MEPISITEYKGYTIKTFDPSGIQIFLGEEPIPFTGGDEEHYEGSQYSKIGLEAAKQFIDELEEKENSL